MGWLRWDAGLADHGAGGVPTAWAGTGACPYRGTAKDRGIAPTGARRRIGGLPLPGRGEGTGDCPYRGVAKDRGLAPARWCANPSDSVADDGFVHRPGRGGPPWPPWPIDRAGVRSVRDQPMRICADERSVRRSGVDRASVRSRLAIMGLERGRSQCNCHQSIRAT
jgi:hypothetical protein